MSKRRTPKDPASAPRPWPDETCADCIFWASSLTSSGVCFRYPPTMLAGMGPGGVRPVLMGATRACGEYASRVEPARAAGFKS